MCGGTRWQMYSVYLDDGLSPRVRGNPAYENNNRRLNRSIPACAGEPHADALIDTPCKVYPRVCGGTQSSHATGVAAAGLSPRVRGNRLSAGAARRPPGSIPACAGEPQVDKYWRFQMSVYPRVCGGTNVSCQVAPSRSGLSPRVRGNLYLSLRKHGYKRSIPACAGEPTSGSVTG